MAAPTSEDFASLTSAVSALTSAMAGTKTEEEKSLDRAKQLDQDLNNFAAKVKAATGKIPGTESITKSLEGLSDGIKQNIQKMASIQSMLSNLTLLPADVDRLKDNMRKLNEEISSSKVTFDALVAELNTNQEQFDELNAKLKQSLGDEILNNVFGMYAEGVKTVLGRFSQVIGDAMKMAADGIKKAANLSITAQEGVALEFTNQRVSIVSAFKNLGDPNKIVNKEQLYAAQEGITEALGGISDGLELDPGAISNMVSGMREGLNSQITPTAETFRSLAQMGIEPTTEGLSDLREASGRAGLGLAQMTVLSKNAMAVQIFGQGIVKTTLDLERMGISIQSVMRQSEAYVTNLDGAIDSIAQLNQLGVQLDFGELTQLQEFDPAAAIQYVADRISPEQLQSTSFRALLASVPGINMEEVLKLKGMEGLQNLEKGTTKQATEVGVVTNMLTSLTQVASVLNGSFVGLTVSAVGASLALFRLASAPGFKANLGGLTGQGGLLGSLSTNTGGGLLGAAKRGLGAAKSGMGIAGSTLAGVGAGVTTYAQTKDLGRSIITGIASMVASFGSTILVGMIPFVGPILAPFIGPMLGAWLGKTIVDYFYKADDMTSIPGYGDRTLVTPSGNYALNNQDTVVAGTNLFSKGSLGMGGGRDSSALKGSLGMGGGRDSSALVAKIDRLISVLESAETTVVVNNTSQRVKRATLVGVRTRDEAEA